MFRFVRSLTNLPRKKFHFRLADDSQSAALTGFGHNAVPPFGLAIPIPIIVEESLLSLQPPVVWAGGKSRRRLVRTTTTPYSFLGGHVDWKIIMRIADFVKTNNCYVADVIHQEGDEADNEEEPTAT